MTRSRPPIVQERVLPAPPEEVFAAWHDPESLRRWMCPGDDMTAADVEVDFRIGGRYRIVMHGDRDYAQHGEYLVIDPPRRLVFTWISEWMPEAEQRTRVELTLEATADGHTRLRLVHDELPPTNAYDGHVAGWGTILRKLDETLRTNRAP